MAEQQRRPALTSIPIDDPDLITRQQAADLLRCGLRTLFNLRARGAFPEGTVEVFHRHSGGNPLIRYRQSKLEQFIGNDWYVVSDTPGEASDSDAQTGE